MQSTSPLRYPGGKSALTSLLSQVVEHNRLGNCRYVEPFAGGGGAALGLLFSERVQSVLLNDLDYSVFCFWDSVINRPGMVIDRLQSTPVNVGEWRRQRAIYQTPNRHSRIAVGFATLYLNRCNRSGIIATAGPIGGAKQEGPWKIGVRFNKEELQRRIERITDYGTRVQATQDDVLVCLRKLLRQPHSANFVYLDPPYYRKGPCLYLNALEHADHLALSVFLRERATFPWVMTYDDHPSIRAMYSWCTVHMYKLRYSATHKEMGSELLISPKGIVLPSTQTSEAVSWARTAFTRSRD